MKYTGTLTAVKDMAAGKRIYREAPRLSPEKTATRRGIPLAFVTASLSRTK